MELMVFVQVTVRCVARRAEHKLQLDRTVVLVEYKTAKHAVDLLYPSRRVATERHQLRSCSENQKTHHKVLVRFGSSLSAPFLRLQYAPSSDPAKEPKTS